MAGLASWVLWGMLVLVGLGVMAESQDMRASAKANNVMLYD